MKCPHCGAELYDEAKWCIVCGKKIEKATPPESAENQMPEPVEERLPETENHEAERIAQDIASTFRKEEKKCPYCGAEWEESNKWCVVCGKKLETDEPAPAKVGKKCPYCGAELAEDDKWCVVCGKKLEADEPAPVPAADGKIKCPSCNAELPEGTKWCLICGYDLIKGVPMGNMPGKKNRVKPEKPPRKKLKKGVVALIVVGVTVVGMIAGGVIYYFNSTERAIFTDIKEGFYDNALESYESINDSKVKMWIVEQLSALNLKAYDKNFRGGELELQTYIDRVVTVSEFENENTRAKIIALFDKLINDKKDEFTAKTVEYETAHDTVSALIATGLITNEAGEADTVFQYIEELNASRVAFALAEESMGSGDYRTAVLEYRKVSEIDEDYPTAQTQLAAAEESFRNQILADTENCSDRASYETAILTVKEALTVLPDDAKLTERLDTLTTEYGTAIKAEIFPQADAAREQGDYATAISIIRDYSELLENDSEYQAYWTDLQVNYCNDIATAAAELVTGNRYEKAVSLYEEAIRLLPDNQTLKDQYLEFLNFKPTRMMDMGDLEVSNASFVSDEDKTDANGELHEVENLYKLSSNSGDGWSNGTDGSVTVHLNGGYTRFRGIIASTAETADDAKCSFVISGDEVDLLTVSDLWKTTETPVIDLDVTGVDTLQFKLVLEEGSSATFFLDNFSFFRIG